MDEKWIQSLVVGNRQTLPPRKQRGEEDKDPDDEFLLKENVHKQASFELPVELTDNGIQVLKHAQVSMMCTMPSSRINGRWSGTLEGQSSLNPSAENLATGSLTLDYKATSWSKISFGMIRGHELHHPLITIGGSLLRDGSAMGVTFYHNPSFLHPDLLQHSMYSIYFRHVFPGSRWRFTSQISRSQEMSMSLTNSKIEGGLGMNLRQPKKIHVRFGVRPKLSEHRRFHLYFQSNIGELQMGASMIQSLHSHVATIGVGLRVLSSRGLEWVITWNRGDGSIRIPIIISRALSTATMGHVLYLSVVSFLIQEALADMWGWRDPPEAGSRTVPKKIGNVDKARRDAEVQRELMARQANRKKREEQEKDGLVIQEAVYRIDGGDVWDCTAQLQFWVSQSSLSLPATSKKELLGFYDLTSGSMVDDESQGSKAGSWWAGVWDDLLDLTSADATKKAHSRNCQIPTLTVRYEFKGQLYRLTVKDHEALKIPNPLAIKLEETN